MLNTPKVHAGHDLREVTKDEFFTTLYADHRDIMPFVRGSYPYTSEWATNNNARTLFGVSEGIANSTESHYFLRAEVNS